MNRLRTSDRTAPARWLRFSCDGCGDLVLIDFSAETATFNPVHASLVCECCKKHRRFTAEPPATPTPALRFARWLYESGAINEWRP